MATQTEYDFVLHVLAFIDEEDLRDVIRWNINGEHIAFVVICNDLTDWGCADAQVINEENFAILKQSVAECNVIDPALGSIVGCELFVCRVRGTRPQGAAYPGDRKLWALFDACGPERAIGVGNPYAPGMK